MSDVPTGTKKRSHSEAMIDSHNNTNNSGSVDPIVGLNVCGKLYYCHQSTLMNASPYFASRFKGNFNSSVAYTDPQGHNVYFVERPPTTFPYIFEFIVSGGCIELPCFQKHPELIRNLRNEADFFGLDCLTDKLKVTKTITPQEGNRGVLYWLGTDKGTAPYENPYTLGAIHVGGWMEDEANNRSPGSGLLGWQFKMSNPGHCRASFVQYRELLDVIPSEVNGEDFELDLKNCLLWCDNASDHLPVVLELKSVLLRPTHYSLRTSQCYGMQGDWNFEGSDDGTTWEVLHAARNDKNLRTYSESDTGRHHKILTAKLNRALAPEEDSKMLSEEEKSRRALELLEKEFRYTWELTPPPTNFYRFFRIIGAAEEDMGSCGGCLHGEGIELFGDIYEE